ncbi:hypothetical protein EV426DRAFT_580611 [Tirmania nivea]|nr:hypothetical protein EV426DRAFT_580611 [Tirmania nivea]
MSDLVRGLAGPIRLHAGLRKYMLLYIHHIILHRSGHENMFSVDTVDGVRWPVPMKGFLMLHHLLWVGLGMVGLVQEVGNQKEDKGVDREKRREPGGKRRRKIQPQQSPTTQVEVSPCSPELENTCSPQDQQDDPLPYCASNGCADSLSAHTGALRGGLRPPRSVSGSSSSSSESIFDHPTRQAGVGTSAPASTAMLCKHTSWPPSSLPQGAGSTYPEGVVIPPSNMITQFNHHDLPEVLDAYIDIKLYRVIDDFRQDWPAQNRNLNVRSGYFADDSDLYSSSEDCGDSDSGGEGGGCESGDGIDNNLLDSDTSWYERSPDLMRELEWVRDIWAAQ